MSRSYKHSPCLHWLGNTNKLSKKTCNKRFRRISKLKLFKDLLLPIKLREVMNIYEFNRDGRAVWIKNINIKYLRK